MTTAIEFGQSLIETIASRDAKKSLSMIRQLRENMRDVAAGADYVNWIISPENLTRVHKALAEDLSVPPRAMAIKRMAMTRTQRAMLLTQAMEIGVKKTHNISD